jgi:hypothetical protein
MSIALAFLVISSLILWFVIGSKGMWGIKAVTISAALYFCLSIGMSLENLAGWPSIQGLPEEFRVYWIVVQEPDKKSGDKGAIFVWVKDTDPKEQEDEGWLVSFYSNNRSEPRAYQLPYSRELHEDAEEAIKTIRAGGKVGGKKGGEEGEGDGEGEGGGKKGQDGNKGGGSLSDFSGIIFHELPPSKLPEKR